MKIRLIHLVIFLWLFDQIPAASQTIPAAVVQNLTAKYPESQGVEWEFYNDQYTATFFDKKGDYTLCIFQPDGTWLETTTQILETELPSRVKSCWKKKYPEIRSVTAIVKVETPKKKPKYHISFETKDSLVNLVFNTKGRLKKKIEEPIAIEN